ncbi:MAG: ABC transporter [Clostridiales bacterium]|nr:ABC transporter [Clostridiales bacterium]
MLAIYKREMHSYFVTPIGFVYLAIFWAVSACVCTLTTLHEFSIDTSMYFLIMLFVFIIVVPILTMKLFSEERKLKTEQMLMTAPVSITSMVVAKYLAAFTLFAGSLVISCVNFIPLYLYAKPQSAIVFGSVIGIMLVGSAFVAIGTFISSLTENQLAAAVSTTGILLFLLAISFVNRYIDTYFIRSIIDWISIFQRFQAFNYGIFDFTAILYYASISAIFIFLTIRVYERRRWGA